METSPEELQVLLQEQDTADDPVAVSTDDPNAAQGPADAADGSLRPRDDEVGRAFWETLVGSGEASEGMQAADRTATEAQNDDGDEGQAAADEGQDAAVEGQATAETAEQDRNPINETASGPVQTVDQPNVAATSQARATRGEANATARNAAGNSSDKDSQDNQATDPEAETVDAITDGDQGVARFEAARTEVDTAETASSTDNDTTVAAAQFDADQQPDSLTASLNPADEAGALPPAGLNNTDQGQGVTAGQSGVTPPGLNGTGGVAIFLEA